MRIRNFVMPLVVASSALVSGYSATVEAAEGMVCASAPMFHNAAFSPVAVNDQLKFQCGAMGEVTIPELYRNGWRVVSIWSQGVAGDGGQPGFQWAIVIEKL